MLFIPHDMVAGMDITAQGLENLLSALGEQIQALGGRTEIVVIGGSALLALGLVARPTKDVDVVAVLEDGELHSARPLPDILQAASGRVARDFGLPDDWLNAGPTDLLQFGLPAQFWARTTMRRYGETLSVHFAGRLDQVHALRHLGVEDVALEE